MRNMVKKFTGIVILGLVLLAPINAAAKTLGIIVTGHGHHYEEINAAMLDKLSGFINEKGIEVIVQKPSPDIMSWVNSARKLKAIGSDVIITYGMTATLTAMKEITDVPILFAGVYNPEQMNIAGKNATGISSTVSVETVLRHLKAISGFSSLGVVFSKVEKDSILQAKEVKNLEKTLGFQTVLINVGTQTENDKVNASDALLFTTSCAAMCQLDQYLDLARKKKAPSAALANGGEEKGVIITLSASPEEQGSRLAEMVMKAFAGAGPDTMPIQQPAQLDLTINQQEAVAMGIEIPADLLKLSTKVIK